MEGAGKNQARKMDHASLPHRKAEEAYRLLDENPQETIQILVTYS